MQIVGISRNKTKTANTDESSQCTVPLLAKFDRRLIVRDANDYSSNEN